MPSISTISLRIQLFTNFQDEPILFSKNFIHTDDKEFSVALGTPAIGEYPYIATNVFYKSDLFTSSSKYKIKDIAEIIFNEDKLIGYLTSKYGKTDKSIGLNVNDNDQHCVDNKCTSEIIQNNVLITLMSLFPVSFPTINNIVDSHTLMWGSTGPHFFSSTTMNEVITNKFYNSRYSYLKNQNNIYTFSKLIWLNDVLNHPYYSKFIKKFHKYYQYLLNNYELNNKQQINEYIKDIDKLITDLFIDPYENVLIPFVNDTNENILRDLIDNNTNQPQIQGKPRILKGGILTRSQTKKTTVNKANSKKMKYNNTKKKGVKFNKTTTNIQSIKILTDTYKIDILRLMYIKHILEKLKSENADEINVEYIQNIILTIYDNISQQLKEQDKPDTFKTIKSEIKDIISQYTGEVYYISEDIYEELVDDENWISDPKNPKKSTKLDNKLNQSISFDSKQAGFKNKNIDDLYKTMDSNTELYNYRTFYTHLYTLSQQFKVVDRDFITNNRGFVNTKTKYSKKYKSDMDNLLNSSRLYDLIVNIQQTSELKNIKNINNVKSIKSELSKIGEVIQFSQITSEFGRGTTTNKYGASSNKLLNDLITEGKLKTKKNDNNIADISKYSNYYPINDKTTKNIHDYDYLESIYNYFYEDGVIDLDMKMLEYIMNTGINIKTDIEGGGGKWSEIYVIADFLEGEINDENISEIKCKYYNEKLGLLIDDMVDQDNEYNNWNVQSSRLYITNKPDENEEQENGSMPPGQGPMSGPTGIMPQGQRPGPGGIMPPREQDKNINKGDEENILRNFTDFVLDNNIIKEKLIDYNTKNKQIPETSLGKHILEKNPLFFDLLRTWNNLENNKFDSQFISNYRIKVSKLRSDIDQQIETEEIRLKQPNINQDQEYQFKSRKRRYELYKVILDEIKKNGDSLVSDSKI